jgi:hypothetical protein
MSDIAQLPAKATDSEYELKVIADEDIMAIPFRVYAGRDYQLGDLLDSIAYREAATLLGLLWPLVESVKVYLFPISGASCQDDTDPDSLAFGQAVR